MQFDQAVGALPNPDWPVSQQLEHAVSTIKKNVKLVMDAKAEASVFKKVGNHHPSSGSISPESVIACFSEILNIFCKFFQDKNVLILIQRMEEMEKEIKARESEVIQRDKVITELRLRLPATAERDKVIDKVMATTTNAMQGSDYESQQAYKVAQSTVQSLQVSPSIFKAKRP